MADKEFKKLIDGYRSFHKEYISSKYEDYRSWAKNVQKPKVMIISCSDSRVNPAIITQAGLGEVFVVNNVANLVPPYKQGKETHHSTSAALEFAIVFLKVRHIIVIGHSGCGGIKALMEGTTHKEDGIYSFIEPWMDIAVEAKERVLKEHSGCSQEEKNSFCEKEALITSLKNLKTFPWVQAGLDSNTLTINAWHFDIASGKIDQYNRENGEFECLLEAQKQ